MTARSLNEFLHNPELPGEAFSLEGTNNKGVLLFHGFTATCSEVNKLGKVLHRLGYSVSAPLLPGHGSRPEELNRARWQDWVAAAESAYQQMSSRCQKVIVGGESNGGLIALYLAAQHPEIRAVLAYAPALRLPLNRWQRLQVNLMAPFVASIPKGDLAGDKTWQGYKVNPLKALQQLMRLEREVEQRLPKISQPALIVQGRKDRTIDPRSAEMVYEKISSTEKSLHWMENSGHCVLLDKEQHEVNRLTIDFLFKVG